MHPPSARDLAIELAFRDAADHVERSGDGGWRLAMVAGGAMTILRATIVDDDWLVASVLHAWSARSWWPVLQLNAGLDGCVRLMPAPSGGLELRGEIFVNGHTPFCAEDESFLRERIAGLCSDIVSAGRQVVGVRAGDTNGATPPSSSDPEALLRHCHDGGWEARALGSGYMQVALDTRSAVCHATLSLGADGRLRAVAPLATAASPSPESQEAIARVLLAASTQLRAVKALVIRQEGGEIAGLSFAGERQPATAETVDCALAALSVACRAVELEVQALQNVDLAREYLTIRGVYPADVVSPASYEQEDMSCLQLP